ncbi:MAG TPA: FecR family protein [Blastocatellia bacterium]|nr:FecR family protein [Blastocatellia bacterium]
MFTRILFFAFVLGAGVLVPGAGCVGAQDLVSARVLSTEGQVEIRRQPDKGPRVQKIAYKVDDEVRAGDTIITGKGGRLVLGLSDGSQAVIAAQTTVVVKDLTESPRTLFHVIKGRTRIHIEKLGGQPNPYRVNTPTAVIAVRGTIFDVLVNGDETQVFLHEGEVAVTNLTFPDQPVILRAGQMTRVLLQRLPARPGSFKIGRNDGTFKEGPGQGSFQRIGRADGGARPDSTRGGLPQPDGGAKPDPGRTGQPPKGGAKPDGSKPNATQGATGRKP